jgi:hypothetical protein
MTLDDVIEKVATLKPHQFDDATVTSWVSDVEMSMWDDIVSHYDDTNPEVEYDDDGELITDLPRPEAYDATADGDTELMVPAPYDDVYIKYCAAQVDYWAGDYARYNNSMIMYNQALDKYASWFNRTYLSKQPTNYGI